VSSAGWRFAKFQTALLHRRNTIDRIIAILSGEHRQEEPESVKMLEKIKAVLAGSP
jgi:hypothetical protein